MWDNLSAASSEVRHLSKRYPEVDWSFSDVGIGFAAGINRLVARSTADMYMLNPDAELTGPLVRTRAALRGERVAAVSPAVVDPSGLVERWDVAHRRQTVGRVLLNHAGYADRLRRTPFSDLYPGPPREVSGYIMGCSLLVRRDAWDDVGPLDERFFVYGEDPDWQRRARRRGWRLLFEDEPDVRHGTEPGASGTGPSGRMLDLFLANTAMMLGMRPGWGRGSLVIGGDLVLDRVQPSKRRARAAQRPQRAAAASRGPDVVITAPSLNRGEEVQRRVELANALSGRHHRVTVVCLEDLGVLQRGLDFGVRLLLRPWWLPFVDEVGDEAVLVVGSTPAERRFAAAWLRLGRGAARRSVVAGPDLARLRPDLAAATPPGGTG